VAAVGQPDEWPLEGGSGLAAAAAAMQEAGESARTGVEDVGQAAVAAALAAAAADEAAAAEAVEEVEVARIQGTAEAAPPQQHVQQQAQQLPVAEGLLGACSLPQLQAAAIAWGVRLEISGARAVKRSSRAKRQQQRQAAAGSPGPGGGFPLHVPWMNAQRQVSGWLGGLVAWLESMQTPRSAGLGYGVPADTQTCCGVHDGRQWQLHDRIAAQAAAQSPCYVPQSIPSHPGIPHISHILHIATQCHTPLQVTGEPRFLCDVMVEGLARQLRLCGYDAGVCAHAWVCAESLRSTADWPPMALAAGGGWLATCQLAPSSQLPC
jgi:hypothetical protein